MMNLSHNHVNIYSVKFEIFFLLNSLNVSFKPCLLFFIFFYFD